MSATINLETDSQNSLITTNGKWGKTKGGLIVANLVPVLESLEY